MTGIFLSTICALALNAAPVSPQADTTDVYMIDYVEVKDFDGSQLVGKTISTYSINVTDAGSGAVRTHIIKTVLSGNSAKVAATRGVPSRFAEKVSLKPEEMDKAVFFLNGARVSLLTFSYFDLNSITDVKTLKGAEAAEYLQSLKNNKAYDGETDGRGVVIVTTKSGN